MFCLGHRGYTHLPGEAEMTMLIVIVTMWILNVSRDFYYFRGYNGVCVSVRLITQSATQNRKATENSEEKQDP
jgi:membrane-bound metal-dependent hydrolase YbcI (DUF457 family)